MPRARGRTISLRPKSLIQIIWSLRRVQTHLNRGKTHFLVSLLRSWSSWDKYTVCHWETWESIFAAIGFKHRCLSLMHFFPSQLDWDRPCYWCAYLLVREYIVCVGYFADNDKEEQLSVTKCTVESDTWGIMLVPRTESSHNLHCPLVIILVVQEIPFFM